MGEGREKHGVSTALRDAGDGWEREGLSKVRQEDQTVTPGSDNSR